MTNIDNKVKIVLFGIFCISALASAVSGYFLDREINNYGIFKKDAQEFDSLSKKWGSSRTSFNVLDEIASSAGNELFSVSITKREKAPHSYVLGLMILNGDELDAVISKLLNQPTSIKRLDIINNDIGYLVTVEVSL